METGKNSVGDEDDMRWAAAVHEAGHVVVAWALGLQVQAMCVTDNGEGQSELSARPGAPCASKSLLRRPEWWQPNFWSRQLGRTLAWRIPQK